MRRVRRGSVIFFVPTTTVTYGGNGSSVNIFQNWSHPIPSIDLGRNAITTTNVCSGMIMCGGGVRIIWLLPLVARCLETIDACIWCMFACMSVVVIVWECFLCV